MPSIVDKMLDSVTNAAKKIRKKTTKAKPKAATKAKPKAATKAKKRKVPASRADVIVKISRKAKRMKKDSPKACWGTLMKKAAKTV